MPGPPQSLLARLLELAGHHAELRTALTQDLLQVGSDGRQTLTLGLDALIRATTLDDGSPGRIVVLPFLPYRDPDDGRIRVGERLAELGVSRADARRFADHLPELDRRDADHVGELLDILTQESDDWTTDVTRNERRLDRIRGQERVRYPGLIGQSTAMQALFGTLDRVAHTDATIYIQGENGTGKELVAREIHAHSRRADQPFLVQNCSAMNDNLLESELFGHRRGAFTGAVQDKMGLFEVADNGTFFLDEVGDMSPALQVKLLRVLQEGTFTPVGDVSTRKVDVRAICATNRDLEAMVAEGTFREDLYYRINVIEIRIPPLRERADDIPILAQHFLERAAIRVGESAGQKRLTRDAMRRLVEYAWPGNVRQLENEIERLVILAGPLVSMITEDFLSPRIRHRLLDDPLEALEKGLSLPDALERLERGMIYEELRRNRWNKTHAADALGISRRNLIRKVARYGFDRRAR